MAGAVVRCRVDEQVGKSGYGATAVRAWAVAPHVGEFLPTPTANVDRGQEIQVVPGGIDDHVEVDLPTIRRDNAACVDDGGLAGFHVDVITGQRRVVSAGITDDALSVRREVGRDLLRQFGSRTKGSVDVVQAHLQQHVVGRRDRQVVLRPLRIPQDDGIVVVGCRPVGLQPVPVRVVRQSAAEVASVLRHVVSWPLARCHPVRLPLKHRQAARPDRRRSRRSAPRCSPPR